MKKCSFIRSDNKNSCPFGLPITAACHNAGNSVAHMCPMTMIEETKREVVKTANLRVYIYYKTGDRCIYAANVMDKQNVVNCDFGDSAAGMHAPPMEGSPLYTQTFAGVGLDGLYAYPLGFYADNNQSRNLFEGLFSLIGEDETFEIVKEALSNNILDKLENNEKLTTEERLEIENSLSSCREKYNNDLDTNEKIEIFVEKFRR